MKKDCKAEAFRDALSKALRSSGQTQKEFAATIGISASYLSSILSGERAGLRRMNEIAEAAGITDLIEESACIADDRPRIMNLIEQLILSMPEDSQAEVLEFATKLVVDKMKKSK